MALGIHCAVVRERFVLREKDDGDWVVADTGYFEDAVEGVESWY